MYGVSKDDYDLDGHMVVITAYGSEKALEDLVNAMDINVEAAK